jgi:hypothetical protein
VRGAAGVKLGPVPLRHGQRDQALIRGGAHIIAKIGGDGAGEVVPFMGGSSRFAGTKRVIGRWRTGKLFSPAAKGKTRGPSRPAHRPDHALAPH